MVSSAKLDSNWLFDCLKKYADQSEIKTWCLAYSGGVDSQVLLHLLSALNKTHGLNIRAIYIDHGLQQASKQWQQHCAKSCESLSIPFQSIYVNAHAKGESPEAAARHARYGALAELISDDSCLLTAQHQDDQAETFLLQLFRGAGAAGLSAMPVYTKFSKGFHLRPLLGISQKQILDYAEHHQLSWVEDPSNQDHQYDRNYLRHSLMPLLKQRWPAIDKTLSVAAQQQAENASLINQLAQHDLEKTDTSNNSLCIEQLKKMSDSRCRNLLRYWIKLQGFDVAPRKVMQQIIAQVFYAKDDAMPDIRWSDIIVHRFKNRLYVLKNNQHDATRSFGWHAGDALIIDSLAKKLVMEQTNETGLAEIVCQQKLQVRFRQGGEKIQPAGRNGHRGLKKLFQEASVPPWERSRIPLIYLDEELIAVAGYWIADAYKAEENAVAYFPRLIKI